MSDAIKETTLKVTGDVKDAVNHVAAELGNLTQREAIEYLLTLHRERQEQAIGFTVPELDKLRHHCSRIEGIYTEWALSTRDREQQDENRIAELQQQVLIARAQESEARQEADRVVDEAAEQTKALREEVDQRTQSWQEERERLLAQVMEAKLAQSQSAQLAQLAQESADQVKQRLAQLEQAAREAGNLRRERDKALSTLQQCERELERATQQSALDLERAVLETERKYLTTVHELHEGQSALREENARLHIQLAQG